MINKSWLSLVVTVAILFSCSPSKRIAVTVPSSMEILLADSVLAGSHTGIYVYSPSTGKALFSHQSDKYFVPASNTKLFSCYAGMKYLGDSLVGLGYQNFSDTAINIFPTGDPTFLHSDFTEQPVLDFLKMEKRSLYIGKNEWKENAFGKGWSWDDYNESYMAERSPMPIYGNTIKIKLKEFQYRPHQNVQRSIGLKWTTVPSSLDNLDSSFILPSMIASKIEMRDSVIEKSALQNFNIRRDRNSNALTINYASSKFTQTEIPFFTDTKATVVHILEKDFGINKIRLTGMSDNSLYPEIPKHLQIHVIHSQPTDSLLKPMMHRSDNFFAEQTLLMVSNEKLGYMNDRAIIDTLLKTDLKDLPQKPVWVDGSGLSRYNLFTPQDFVKILEKMKTEFGIERMKNILPTGGEGTLTSLYKPIANQIFAKTGTLSGQVALSGYLFTKNNSMLIFSILVNNHTGTATNVRKAVEKFVMSLWEKN
ncbi:MAG: D-alanyl-D-alanine carboxypeptidase [Bacteroidota bacterium]